MNCSKILLISANSLLLLCGIAAAICSILMSENIIPEDLTSALPAESLGVGLSGLFLGIGIFMVVMALLGLWGGWTGNRFLLWSYLVVMLILSSVQMTIGSFLVMNKYTSMLKFSLFSSVGTSYQSQPAVWNADFGDSCPVPATGEVPSNADNVSCCNAVEAKVYQDWWTIGIVCLVMACVQFFLILFSFIAIRNHDTYEKEKIRKQQKKMSKEIKQQQKELSKEIEQTKEDVEMGQK